MKSTINDLDIRGVLARKENLSCLVVPKPTGADKYIILCGHC